MSESAKIVYYPSPGKVYSREEMAEVFARFGPQDPVIQVMRQIFQQRFASAALDAALPRMSEREAGHAGGRIQEITDFRDEILGYLSTRDEVNPEEASQPMRLRKKRN